MNALTTFSSPTGSALRTLTIAGNPWFIAKDVCDALALDTTRVRRHLNVSVAPRPH